MGKTRRTSRDDDLSELERPVRTLDRDSRRCRPLNEGLFKDGNLHASDKRRSACGNLKHLNRVVHSCPSVKIEALVRAGASVSVYNSKGQTVLHRVLTIPIPAKERRKLVKFLLEAGSDANAIDRRTRRRPLLIAVLGKLSVRVLQLLVDHGADMDARSQVDDGSAVEVAARLRLRAAVRFLVERGAYFPLELTLLPVWTDIVHQARLTLRSRLFPVLSEACQMLPHELVNMLCVFCGADDVRAAQWEIEPPTRAAVALVPFELRAVATPWTTASRRGAGGGAGGATAGGLSRSGGTSRWDASWDHERRLGPPWDAGPAASAAAGGGFSFKTAWDDPAAVESPRPGALWDSECESSESAARLTTSVPDVE